MNGRYLTVSEVAETFNVSTTLIYRLIRDEIIDAIKIGETYRISPQTVENLKDGGLLE